RTGVDTAHVDFLNIRHTNDVWREHDDNFRRVTSLVFASEQILHDWYVFQAWKAGHGSRFGISNQATKNICFTFHQPDLMLNLTVREHGLRHASHVSVAGERADLNHHRH